MIPERASHAADSDQAVRRRNLHGMKLFHADESRLQRDEVLPADDFVRRPCSSIGQQNGKEEKADLLGAATSNPLERCSRPYTTNSDSSQSTALKARRQRPTMLPFAWLSILPEPISMRHCCCMPQDSSSSRATVGRTKGSFMSRHTNEDRSRAVGDGMFADGGSPLPHRPHRIAALVHNPRRIQRLAKEARRSSTAGGRRPRAVTSDRDQVNNGSANRHRFESTAGLGKTRRTGRRVVLDRGVFPAMDPTTSTGRFKSAHACCSRRGKTGPA